MKTSQAFSFSHFFIQKSHIERLKPEEIGSMNIDIDVHGYIHAKDKTFQLDIIAKVWDESEVFNALVHGVGIFEFENLQNKNIESYFYLNAPAILFPYIRAYVTSLTSLSGLNPITLPTLNLESLKNKLKENTELVED
ncbi:MAG: protein-export chaperone SecB [Bacteroidales bacterium]|nr:protein-export chaperone SecB [Bacteroidales bacterium]